MAATSLTNALLLFIFGASWFGPAAAEPCVCQPPLTRGGVSVVPGRIICKNFQEIPRNFFTSLENRLDCKKSLETPVELTFENVGNRVFLSPSSFDSPVKKVSLKRVDFKQVCLSSIAPNFFSGFFDASELTTLAFQDVRCLQVIPQSSFAGLKKLNTFRWIRGSVRKIEAGAFAGLPALEEFTVQNTRLRELPAQLFEEATSLGDLILSENQIESIPATFFNFKAKKVKLYLSGNKIKTLPSGAFDKLQLESLDLQGNGLTSFSVDILGKANQKNVSVIKLSDNQLTELNRNLVIGRNIEKFNLFVDGNPWNCVCDLMWFRSYFGEGEGNIVCASPPAFKGLKVNSLSELEFCPTTPAVRQPSDMAPGGGISRSKDPGYKSVTESPALKGASVGGGGGPSSQELIAIGTSVAVIVVALICFFLIYRFRGRICKSKEKTQKQEYQPANTDEGYDGEPPVRTYVV